MTKNEDICDMSAYRTDQQNKEYEAFRFLRAMKGHKLLDGGVIDSITVTFTDKKTKKKRIVKI